LVDGLKRLADYRADLATKQCDPKVVDISEASK